MPERYQDRAAIAGGNHPLAARQGGLYDVEVSEDYGDLHSI